MRFASISVRDGAGALFGDAETDERYDPEWMMAIRGGEDVWGDIGGELGAGGGEEVADAVVAVVAEGVSGDVADR